MCSGQRLSHDVQHIPSSLVVDGARSWLPGDASAWLSLSPWWPSCHHCLRVSPWLPVHRGVEFSHSDLIGCMYLTHAYIKNTYTVFQWFFSFLNFNLQLKYVMKHRNNTQTSVVTQPVQQQSPNSWSSLLRQLFGFVYACYVSKVFQDDEDSCECFCLHQDTCWSSSSALFSR